MTAIPTRNRDLVKARDKHCLRCGGPGTDMHHRRRRKDGGHLLVNLIWLCHGCHMWAHANPAEARRLGFIVKSLARIEVEDVPIRILDTTVSVHPFYVRLTPEGGRTSIRELDALEYLALVA